MSFEVRVNGETVWKPNKRCTRVQGVTNRGELFNIGIDLEDQFTRFVDLRVTEVREGDPDTLSAVDQLEREKAKTRKLQSELQKNRVKEGETNETSEGSSEDNPTVSDDSSDDDFSLVVNGSDETSPVTVDDNE